MAHMVRALLAALALLTLAACPSSDQTLVLIGGERVDARGLDEAPLSVLPSGALFIGQLDARALFRSSLGGQVAQVVANLLPLGPESNFSPQRDVDKIVGAVYAMQGADFVAVLQGNFDLPALQRAALTRVQTPSGLPVVQTRYAGYDIFTVANVGFVALTPRTMLSGNETGMRRALDALRYGEAARRLPRWMTELLEDQRAAFAIVGDVAGQGVVAAAAPQLPFLNGLSLLRVQGNFEAPGMNVVGSLTYADGDQAGQGAQGLGQLQQLAYFGSLLATWGFGGSMPELEVAQQGTNVAFATKVDTGMMNLVLSLLVNATRPGPGQPSIWGG